MFSDNLKRGEKEENKKYKAHMGQGEPVIPLPHSTVLMTSLFWVLDISLRVTSVDGFEPCQT